MYNGSHNSSQLIDNFMLEDTTMDLLQEVSVLFIFDQE